MQTNDSADSAPTREAKTAISPLIASVAEVRITGFVPEKSFSRKIPETSIGALLSETDLRPTPDASSQ